MNLLYSELQWLPRAPREFNERLKGLGSSEGEHGREVQSLALHGLDLNQLTKLAKIISRLRAEGKSLNPMVPFRLAVLSNSTIDLIVPAVVASAARHGIALQVIQPSYDQVAQEALLQDSKVNSSNPDAVLIALDYRALPLKLSLADKEAATVTVQGVLGYLQMLRNGVKSNSNAVCIFQTFGRTEFLYHGE
jgi:predicted enzyme involved in methoxymalonyl-ACP biosynthesis